VAGAVGAEVTVTVTLGLAETVAVRLGKLPIELLMVLPHPASNPAASRVTGRESRFAERRMLILPRRLCRPLEPPLAGGRDRCRAGPDSVAASLVIRRRPGWAEPAYDTIVTVRRRAWGQIRRFRHTAFGCCIPRLLSSSSPTAVRFHPGEARALVPRLRRRGDRPYVT
jgi:hypothetical protein